jgi:hypothetical protein
MLMRTHFCINAVSLYFSLYELITEFKCFNLLILLCADCQKVLTLYGMSNLVSEDEHSLDIMDPYQRDAKIIGKLTLYQLPKRNS